MLLPGHSATSLLSLDGPIEGRWCTVGFRHLTRAEDWLMPTLWHGFRRRLTNFFARNPAMDASMMPVVPPAASAK